jgi:hypothetical protein
MDKSSLFKISGLPDPFGVVLLVFSLILLLAPYFSGTDFGLFKIPIVSQSAKKLLKIIGPLLFVSCILFFLPIFPKNQQEPSASSADPPLEGIGKASSGETSPSPLIRSEPGRTGITLRWNGSNTVSWYLYNGSGEKPLSPHGPFRWYCDPGKSATEDTAPGDYVVKLQSDVDVPIESSTFAPIKVSVQSGHSTQITPAVGRVTLRWNGSNTVSWYLYDGGGQKPLSPQGAFRWYCDPGKSSTQDVSPGEYSIKLQAVGYQPIAISVKSGQETSIVRP